MNSNHHVSLLATRQQSACCVAETCVEYVPGSFLQMAGLSYMYDSLNFFILGKTVTDDGESVLSLIRCDRGADEVVSGPVPLPKEGKVYLRAKVEKEGAQVRFYYHLGDEKWMPVGEGYSTEILTDEYCRGFTGAHFGMYVHDMVRMETYADFHYFEIRQGE